MTWPGLRMAESIRACPTGHTGTVWAGEASLFEMGTDVKLFLENRGCENSTIVCVALSPENQRCKTARAVVNA